MAQTNETKRDLLADLALCEAVTPGPWYDNGNEIVSVNNPYVGIAGAIKDEDARFIAEAREGWPHAIRRALEAEKRVAELEAEVERLKLGLREVVELSTEKDLVSLIKREYLSGEDCIDDEG